jgi:hypothetical protein
MSALKINVRVLQHHLLLCIKVTVVYLSHKTTVTEQRAYVAHLPPRTAFLVVGGRPFLKPGHGHAPANNAALIRRELGARLSFFGLFNARSCKEMFCCQYALLCVCYRRVILWEDRAKQNKAVGRLNVEGRGGGGRGRLTPPCCRLRRLWSPPHSAQQCRTSPRLSSPP